MPTAGRKYETRGVWLHCLPLLSQIRISPGLMGKAGSQRRDKPTECAEMPNAKATVPRPLCAWLKRQVIDEGRIALD